MTVPLSAHDCRTYRSELYVNRPVIETEITRWLSEPHPQHLIRSLIGPPGTGKSWILAHLEEAILSNSTQILSPKCVLRLSAPDLVGRAPQATVKQRLVDSMKECYDQISYPSSSLPTLAVIIETLRDQIAGECDATSFLLIIDDLDELTSPSDWDEVQDLLARFLDDKNRCFRILIARRSRLTDYRLRKLDRPIPIDTFEIGANAIETSAEQIEKLLTHHSIEIAHVNLSSVLPSGCNYPWNHPYINCFLLTHFCKHYRTLPVDSLLECCKSLISRKLRPFHGEANYASEVASYVDLLLAMVRSLPEQWTSADFRQVSKRSLGVDDIQSGMIVNIQNADGTPSPSYRIAEGLRELLMDIAMLQETENKS